MDIQSRIHRCRMLEKMAQQKEVSQRLGLCNQSTLHKEPIQTKTVISPK